MLPLIDQEMDWMQLSGTLSFVEIHRSIKWGMHMQMKHEKQVVYGGMILHGARITQDSSNFSTYRSSCCSMVLPPCIVSCCSARREEKRFMLLMSFPLSTTTGKVWHCCVECDFDIGDHSFRWCSSASGSESEWARERLAGWDEDARWWWAHIMVAQHRGLE